MLLFISTAEIIVTLIIVVMIFGADKLPQIARELGKGMRQVKNATNQIKQEIQSSAIDNDFAKNEVENIQKEVGKTVEGLESSISRGSQDFLRNEEEKKST